MVSILNCEAGVQKDFPGISSFIHFIRLVSLSNHGIPVPPYVFLMVPLVTAQIFNKTIV
jgi:hypothetical protein